LDFINLFDQGASNIPAHPGLARGLHGGLGHAPNQGGGGGFPGRTSDADHRAGDFFHKNLRVVAERQAAAAGFDQDGQGEGNPT
jgi:hypothetical protein